MLDNVLIHYTLNLLKKFCFKTARSIALRIRLCSKHTLYSWSWSVESDSVIERLIINFSASKISAFSRLKDVLKELSTSSSWFIVILNFIISWSDSVIAVLLICQSSTS